MRKFYFCCISACILLFFSCGRDGSDGRSYIAFDWDWYVDTYWDNNPSVPSTINRNVEYKSNAGTFSFEYGCSDGLGSSWYWEGNYTIRINEGEPGELLYDGKDGKNRHYSVFLRGLNEPTSSVTERSTMTAEKPIVEKLKHSNELPIPDDKKKYISEPIIEYYNIDNMTIVVEKQKFIIK